MTLVFSSPADTYSSKLLACQKAIKRHLSLNQNQISILAVKKVFVGLNDCTVLNSAARLMMTLVVQFSPLGQY